MFDSTFNVIPHQLTLLPPAFIVFMAAILLEIIQWLGFSLISTWLYKVNQILFHRNKFTRLNTLRKECIQVKKELHSTSSMDEFAKWARLRRQLDSKSADYDRLITEANSTKVWFQIKSQFVTRPLFYLTYSFLIYYFRETPMFYIPKDWFNLAGELMYLPLAPFGSVSVILWMFACRRFVRNFISKDMETMSNKHE